METPRRTTRWKRQPQLDLFTTTLWEHDSQHYVAPDGSDEQGSRDYVGATPSWVIWQLLKRYTRPGDRVLDPMCGSGTTLDVCRDLDRQGIGYDLAPTREPIKAVDARALPLGDNSVDFAFIDPPYSTHVDYSDDPRCIGKLDAGGPDHGRAYYEAMDQVIREIHRVLRAQRCMALYVSDSWREKRKADVGASPRGLLMPIGFELFAILRRYFVPVDIISVVRHNRQLRNVDWHKAAARDNFFIRGFNYLFVMWKPK